MKIGVTGAAGGIGSLLADELYEAGFETVLIDNLSSGSRENFLHEDNRKKLVQADIRDEEAIAPLLSDCQTIIHLAAISSLAACQIDPTAAFSVNLTGTALMAKLANTFGSSIIFASTSAVYENSTTIPFGETLVPNQTLIYPQTKRFAELAIEGMSRSNGLNYVNLRFFNVFGPRQDVRRKNPPLINYLVREHMLGRKSKLYAPPHQRRDYVCASDVIALINSLIRNDSKLPDTDINVCTGVGISLNQILQSLGNGFGESIDFEQGDPKDLWEHFPELFNLKNSLSKEIVEKETLKNSIGDPTKAKELLGWSAKRDVLGAIKEDLPAMKLHVKNSLGVN